MLTELHMLFTSWPAYPVKITTAYTSPIRNGLNVATSKPTWQQQRKFHECVYLFIPGTVFIPFGDPLYVHSNETGTMNFQCVKRKRICNARTVCTGLLFSCWWSGGLFIAHHNRVDKDLFFNLHAISKYFCIFRYFNLFFSWKVEWMIFTSTIKPNYNHHRINIIKLKL